MSKKKGEEAIAQYFLLYSNMGSEIIEVGKGVGEVLMHFFFFCNVKESGRSHL